jgi:hypothetical protein
LRRSLPLLIGRLLWLRRSLLLLIGRLLRLRRSLLLLIVRLLRLRRCLGLLQPHLLLWRPRRGLGLLQLHLLLRVFLLRRLGLPWVFGGALAQNCPLLLIARYRLITDPVSAGPLVSMV